MILETKIWIVPSDRKDKRIDQYIAAELDVSRSMAQQWLADGLVTANGKALSKNYKLRGGEELSVDIPAPVSYEVKAENIPLDVVYEDDDLLVVNKPKGMVVHPAAGHYDGTLVNALLWHCGNSLSGINGVLRPGIVHRIDMDTSGLLIVAKNDKAHQGLAGQIKEHSFTREYEAVVVGRLKEIVGTVDAPIGRHPTNRKKMAVTASNSKPAVTQYRVLSEFEGQNGGPTYSHVRLKLETGRTHQIRVHMAYLGHPVAGDAVYGQGNQPPVCAVLNGQCLHAKAIGFTHPISGEWLSFESELPPYFAEFLQKIKPTR